MFVCNTIRRCVLIQWLFKLFLTFNVSRSIRGDGTYSLEKFQSIHGYFNGGCRYMIMSRGLVVWGIVTI